MNQLTIVMNNGVPVADSREVADMVGMRHADLLEKIKVYLKHLTDGNFRSLDFFIESTYQDSKGETRPNYFLTRKGCDMVANKMTGKKGVLFTAAYVTKFEEMEKVIKTGTPIEIDESKKLRAEAMLRNAKTRQSKTILEMADKFKDKLSNEAIQALLGAASAIVTDSGVLPAPKIDKTYTAEQIAEELGTSSNKVGRIANQNGLKDAKYGYSILGKSKYSDKQVSQFVYNEEGRKALIEAFKQKSS